MTVAVDWDVKNQTKQTNKIMKRNTLILPFWGNRNCIKIDMIIYEPWHEISNNVVWTTSKASDQPGHMRSLIRAFACRLNILWVWSYWLNIIWSCQLKKRLHRLAWVYTCQKWHIVGNHVSGLIFYIIDKIYNAGASDFGYQALWHHWHQLDIISDNHLNAW